MLTLRSGLAWSLIAGMAVLATLGAIGGVTTVAWVTGAGCGVAVNAVAARGLHRSASDTFGPADLVTLVRVALICGVAALVADSFVRPPHVAALVGLATAALILDAVDGWVARRTRTASAFGARFDGEIDALLILVLSVHVADSVGAWVLAIGAARYAFAVAGWGLPWLRGRLPARYWRKLVAAVQGIVLTVSTAGVAPLPITDALLVTALVLLTESFGRDAWWLWRHDHAIGDVDAAPPPRPSSL